MRLPLVSICCITYNHGNYIRECLDGLLLQKTTFSYEILINDDASTDNTANIIKEYVTHHPDVIKPIFQKENQYSKGARGINFRYNFPRAQGKYIAVCEGDDYWTDPLKLQKQVDFLENNRGFSLACGGFKKKYDTSGEFEEVIINDPKLFLYTNKYGFEFDLNDLGKKWLTKTLTVLFRRDTLNMEELNQYHFLRDVHLFYHIIKKGKGIYFQEVLGVYRIHEGGTHSMNAGKEKFDAAYNVHKELFEFNKDIYTRQKFFKSILGKLKFDLHNKYLNNNWTSKSKLTLESFGLIRSPKDFLRVIRVFLSLGARI